MKHTKKILPLILCGGHGTRLWPESREAWPKQFIKINSQYNLFQETVLRVKNKIFDMPILICNERHKSQILTSLQEINCKVERIILEPDSRNTGASVSIGLSYIKETHKDRIVLVLPSDHVIKKKRELYKSIKIAREEMLKEGSIVTFGIKPTYPSTEFGYIKVLSSGKRFNFSYKAVGFYEKPSVAKAKAYLKSKKYFWNSGMFLSQNSILWEEFRKYEKTLLSYAMNSIKKYFFEKKFLIPEKKYFYKCKKISIDDAIMERSKKLLVIPTNIGWTDVGSWRNIWSIGNKDQNKNVLEGDAHIIDSKNCYVRSSSKLTIAAGVKDLAIITTEDAVLVLDKDTFSKSRSISNLLKVKKRQEHNSTVLVYKPWGTYKTILKGKNYQVKEIVINPKSSISLQKHKYRSEHWIIVEGEGLIIRNNQKITLSVNQEIFIPKGTKHRITNKKKSSLKFIEVQIGKYLGEDDIIRYVDQYGRV